MSEAISNTPKPLFEGRGFDLASLSPAEFEKFVFGCLLCIADVLNIRITNNPAGTGDGGFDVQGEIIGSSRLVCVQCKRYSSPLGSPQVAHELAKVAVTARLERSDIGQHRFICTGGVRTKLRKQIRETPRTELAALAVQTILDAKDNELETLREALEKERIDPSEAVESYVLGLDSLIAWDTAEFDAALSPRWTDVLEVADRFFRIESFVREHPRAKFDRQRYIAEHINFKAIIEPRLRDAHLPQGITVDDSTAVPVDRSLPCVKIECVGDFLALGKGELAFLLGDGGIGKSTALSLVRAEALRLEGDSTLPILIPLTYYAPGDLDQLIHQELGVVHGNWKSLPDRILLLCDGLNECPSSHISAFFNELRPLLKRCEVTCIVATRASSRHANIILPQVPVSCKKIEFLTPSSIRRIAEEKISDGSYQEFLNAYLRLVNKASSEYLWTPFAVLVAIQLWQAKNAELPSTLGEMLEALIKERCKRNANSPVQSLMPDVILQLAGALAFECIVKDLRLQCPASDAGRWIRAAKSHCSDALGITEVRDTEIISLLKHHEILEVSPGDQIGFGHQLIAGALAAPIFSTKWRENLSTLGEPVADDIWRFAARFVSPTELEDFLKSAFNMDLILGAKAASELSSQHQLVAEGLLEKSIAPESPKVVRIQGMYALARLGTPKANSILRDLSLKREFELQFEARCARAASGDINFLKHILYDVEVQKMGPGEVSGGSISVWECAPLSLRLYLAREWLAKCKVGEPIRESLELVAFERDINDGPIIERHLERPLNFSMWKWCLFALHRILPDRANEIFQKALNDDALFNKADMIQVAVNIGIHVEVETMFKNASAMSDQTGNDESDPSIYRLITEVLRKLPLPPQLISTLEGDLLQSTGERRVRLWMIAAGRESKIISDLAVSCISRWDNDIGPACDYFFEQEQIPQDLRLQLIELLESGLKNESVWYSWGTFRALMLAGKLGFTKELAMCLSSMIRRLVRVQIAVNEGTVPALSSEDAAVLADAKKPEHYKFHLERFMSHLIRPTAYARDLIATDDLLAFFLFDLHTYVPVKDHREVIAAVPREVIDVSLTKISDPWTKLHALVVTCGIELTDTRFEILAECLRASYCSPAALHIVLDAVESCWCTRVFQMIANTVAEIPNWSRYDSQFFWEFSHMVANRVCKDDLPVIESSLAKAKTPFAKETLESWRDHAAQNRIGLARIAESEGNGEAIFH